jgi:hypothetical protein
MEKKDKKIVQKKSIKKQESTIAEIKLPPSSLNEELEALLKKNPKHFIGCGG